MLRLLVFLCSIASALATGACSDGVYNPPVSKSFVTVAITVGFPFNVTTPQGIVAVIPIRSGDVCGQFNGHLIGNASSVTERLLTSKNGTYSTVDSTWVLENDKSERILSTMHGLTTYAGEALHGHGYASLSTDVEEFEWVNWAHFLIEWEGHFRTGDAKFEFFHITSGGRKDGVPILS